MWGALCVILRGSVYSPHCQADQKEERKAEKVGEQPAELSERQPSQVTPRLALGDSARQDLATPREQKQHAEKKVERVEK